MLKNEHAVQIDSHDTLWGETGMLSSIFLHDMALSFALSPAVFVFWTRLL